MLFYDHIIVPNDDFAIIVPFGRYLAQHLTDSAISTVRFQFPYMEDRKRRPDPPRLLEETWREVIRTVRPTSGRLVVGGRSMGDG